VNKTRIDWCHYTWNPITGCRHGCSYCYARKIATRFKGTKAFPNGFEPTWHPERLKEPLQVAERSRIFVCSMSDPFGDWVDPAWLDKMMDVMGSTHWQRFLLLTKAPQNIHRKLYELTEANPLRELGGNDYLPNVWLGCTLTGAPGESDPSWAMLELRHIGWHTFVSVEPLLGPINPAWYSWAEWIIVGAQTNPDIPPKEEWLEPFSPSSGLLPDVPRFFKNSIALWQGHSVITDYPDALDLDNHSPRRGGGA
jgi:protein gp37